MDQNQWKTLYASIKLAARRLPRDYRLQFSDTLIVAMYFWSVKHDRCMMWACNRKNYNSLFRPLELPSVSQFHKRMRSPRVLEILQAVNDQLAHTSCTGDELICDGQALTVNNVSKDPDAAFGYASGGQLGKGYKLHAITTGDNRILCWCVRPINEHETPIAMRMLDQLPPTPRGSILLADCNYDWHDFHKFAHARGIRLMSHMRGMAKHPVTLRQMGPARRELIKLHQDNPSIAKAVMKNRNKVERTFAHLSGGDGGMGPLPKFVRRLPRVRRWVGAKIALYHIRRTARLAAAKMKADA